MMRALVANIFPRCNSRYCRCIDNGMSTTPSMTTKSSALRTSPQIPKLFVTTTSSHYGGSNQKHHTSSFVVVSSTTVATAAFSPSNSFFRIRRLKYRPRCLYDTACFSTNDDGAESVDTNDTNHSKFLVYARLNDGMKQTIAIPVKEGDDINNIKEAITSKCRPYFDGVSIISMLLYTLPTNKNPIDSLTEWSPNVTWGTKKKPLIIKLSPSAYSSANTLVDDSKEYMEKGLRFVKSIMKPFETIPNSDGMKVLRDVISLEGPSSKDVIIRNGVTIEFWNQVIETAGVTTTTGTPTTGNSEKLVKTIKRHVCAVGTPGIGKTTSTSILIRLLLKQNKTVAYHVRKVKNDGVIYVFTPPETDDGDDIGVKIIFESTFFPLRDPIVNQPGIYYVVDPGKTIDNCDLSTDFKGDVIIVTSPDERHWGGGEFRKLRDGVIGTFLFTPIWRLQELIWGKPHFDLILTDLEIEDRYHEVGGVPRNIFNPDYEEVLKNQNTAINDLKENHIIKMISGDVGSAHTFGADQPKSALMVYTCPDGNFKNFTVVAVSKNATRKIVKKFMNLLWNLIIYRGVLRNGLAWQVFETYCHNIMVGENPLDFFDYRRITKSNENMTSAIPLQLGGCKAIKATRPSQSLVLAAEEEENVMFYSLDPTSKLIDFVYRKGSIYYAFQVTIGDDHTCNIDHLQLCAKEAGGASNLRLFYLTYDTRFKDFQLKPVNPLEKLEGDDWNLFIVSVHGPAVVRLP